MPYSRLTHILTTRNSNIKRNFIYFPMKDMANSYHETMK